MRPGSAKESSRNALFARLAGSVPGQYRQEVKRVANRIRDSFPPVVIERRLQTLERHVTKRLDAIERKVDDILHRLERR